MDKKRLNYKKPIFWIIAVVIVVYLSLSMNFTMNLKREVSDAAKIRLRGGSYWKGMEITDAETIQRITDDVKGMIFMPSSISIGTGGWSYELTWYDAEGNEMESLVILTDNKVSEDVFFYKAVVGHFDLEFYDELLIENGFRKESQKDETENMTEISTEQLEWFSTEFFNSETNRITNMFLTSQYSDVKYIDLRYLFSDVPKVTKEQMESTIQRYLDMSLEEMALVNLDSFEYSKEDDTYYITTEETKWTEYIFERGWKDKEGNIILEYRKPLNSADTQVYRVTLKSINGMYCFVSNVNLLSDNKDTEEFNRVSEEKLEWFNTEFFNQKENPITNQFLNEIFVLQNEVNLYELFYNGLGDNGDSGEISNDELKLLQERYIVDINSDIIKITRKEMDAVLQKYLGLSLDETSKVGLDKMYYLEEYDAYYMMHGDTNYNQYEFQIGKINEDGSITLQYHDVTKGYLYWVTLIERDGTYHFVSNIAIDMEYY